MKSTLFICFLHWTLPGILSYCICVHLFQYTSSGSPGKTNPRFPDGSGSRISINKGHQSWDAGFVNIPPLRVFGLPDITQVGKLLYFLHDTIICDGFTACHSSFNRVLQRMFMQMRLAALDKSMGNAFGYGQQPHSFYLIEPDLVHHLALVYCLCLHFLDCINGDFPRPCLV